MLDHLRNLGIQPSPQRLAVAEYVLHTRDHPSADQVWNKVRSGCPTLSRATVYNTLNLFVRKGLLRQLVLAEGKVLFDPNTRPHHHFVDDTTGQVHDIPWEALRVSDVEGLEGFDVQAYQVVLHGRKTGP